MSVSEMNMSWSTASAQLSSKTLESSTFITAVSKDGKEVRRKPVSDVLHYTQVFEVLKVQ